jgi:hypothetical protein
MRLPLIHIARCDSYKRIPALLPPISPRRRSSCFFARTKSLSERCPAHADDDDDTDFDDFDDDDDDENVEKGDEEEDDEAEAGRRESCGGGASVLSLRTRRVRCACGS